MINTLLRLRMLLALIFMLASLVKTRLKVYNCLAGERGVDVPGSARPPFIKEPLYE